MLKPAFGVGLTQVLVLGMLSGCGAKLMPAEDPSYSRLHGDSGVNGRPYSEIIADFRALALRHPTLAHMVDYGTSLNGATLSLMTITDPSVTVSGKHPAALISEGIHANEYLNITDRLPHAFLEGEGNDGYQQFLAKGGVIYLVPMLNPDGYAARQRENADGVDLNRSFPIRGANYPGKVAPETQALREFVASEVTARNLSLEVSMEYHCCIGALIEPWAYTYTAPAADVRQRAAQVASAMHAAIGNDLGAGTVHEILDYPPTFGGSDDYYLENYGRRAYSFEGREGNEPSYFDGHVRWWNQMFALSLTGF